MKKLLLLFIFFFLSINVFSQKRDRALNFFYESEKIFNIDYLYYPSESKDSINLLFFYKLSNSLFSYEKINIDNNSYFISYANLVIDFKDENGIIKKSITIKDTLICNNFDETKSKNSFKNNYIKITLKKDFYTVIADLNDNSYEKLKSKKINRLDLKTIDYSNSFKYLNVYEDYIGNTIPFINDSSSSFNYENSYLIFLSDKRITDLNYYMTYPENQDDYKWLDSFNLNGKVKPLNLKKSDDPINFGNIINNELNSESLNKFGLELKKIRLDKNMFPGNYKLNLSQNNSIFNIKIVWDDLPKSLTEPIYASEIMYYVLNDTEFKNITSGSKQKVFTNILNYWKSQDPTPNTSYNEKMFSYFNRVDEAFVNYQTINEKDGAKTERGKIYILYGKPERIERKLGNKVNQEVWKYEKLKKEFTFETNPSGIYILKAIK